MTIFDIGEADGWAAIADALAGAAPGDRVEIGPGTYRGAKGLRVPAGVTLHGAAALLEYTGPDAAISAVGADDVVITGIRLNMLRLAASAPVAPVITPAQKSGFTLPYRFESAYVPTSSAQRSGIALTRASGARVEDCHVTAIRGIDCCIIFSLSSDVHARGNVTRGGRSGIKLIGSTGLIEDNDCAESDNAGIELHHDHAPVPPPTRAILRDNRCGDNRKFGIAVTSAHAERMIGNQCNGNGETGIFLSRCPNSRDVPARAHIDGNSCCGNARFGIALSACDETLVQGNQCSDNGLCGIQLENDAVLHAHVGNAIITGNIASDNRQYGILVMSSTSELIGDNDCSSNVVGGISIQRARHSPGIPGSATIRSNICSNSGEGSGIVVLSSACPEIADNDCHGNAQSGIVITQDDMDQHLPSRASINGNRCNDNGLDGILITWSACDIVQNNDCMRNSTGIFLTQAQATPGTRSIVPLIGNRCGHNRASGIVLGSTASTLIKDNDCFDNAEHGICLSRGVSADEPPTTAPVQANHCRDNGKCGILLISSSSDGIDDNLCSGNGIHGICLEPGNQTPAHSSAAPIRANRLWGNTRSGIALLSSESQGIDGNQCWENDNHGIVLDRADVSPQTPSRATITRNICRHNQLCGIILVSSESPDLADNACWGQPRSGIDLERRVNGISAPSLASIRGNQCHHNGHSGINMLSSSAPAIAENHCWSNGWHGIILQRQDISLDNPSSAPVIANLCHNNQQSGILLVSAESDGIEGNHLSGNSADLNFAIHKPDGNAVVEPYLPAADNRFGDDAETVPTGMMGDAAMAIENDGHSPAQARAIVRYLASAGCPDCFAAALSSNRAGAPAARRKQDDPTGDRHRHFQVRMHDGRPQFEPAIAKHRSELASIGTVLQQLKAALQAGFEPKPAWFGLVTADDAAIDQIADLAQNSEAAAPQKSKWGRRPIHALQRFDHGPRNALDGTQPETGLFEAQLAGSRRWGDRLAATARLPELWIAALVPIAVWRLFPGWTHQQVAAIGKWLAGGIGNWATLVAGLIIAASALIGYANLRLPRILAYRQDPLAWAAGLANALFSVIQIKDPWESVSRKFGTQIRTHIVAPIADRAWLHWVRRKLFRHGPGVYPIVITHVEQWQDRDLARLERLACSLPKGVNLCCIVQMDGRVCVHPAMLAVAGAPWSTGFTLLLNDHDEALRLDLDAVHAACADAGEPMLDLLGPAENSDELTRQEFRGSLTDDEWWPLDLLPSLSIGSAPTGKFSLRRTIMRGVGAPLIAELERYERLFVARTPERSWSEPGVLELFTFAAQAPSLRVYQTERGRQRFERIAGRVGRRNAVARLVAGLWHDPADTMEYIASALACGIAHHQAVAIEAIPQARDRGRAIVAERAFEAIIFLAGDLDRVMATGCAVHGHEALDRNWQTLFAMFEEAAAEQEDAASIARLYGPCLGAWSAHRPDDCGGIVAQDLDRILSRHAEKREQAATRSIRDVAVEGLVRDLDFMSVMDVELALQTITRMRAQQWRLLPRALADGVEDAAADIRSRGRSLGQLLDGAVTDTDLELIISLHSAWPERVIYALSHIAIDHARRASADWRADPDYGRTLHHVGRTCAYVASRLSTALNAGGLESRLRADLNLLMQAPRRDGAAAHAWLATGTAGERLLQLLEQSGARSTVIPNVIDQELERLLLIAETIVARTIRPTASPRTDG
ncbi:right-handed parallel beta-helix repeat-containing protein [Sphingomonas colocasiae]|uniref:Right-handed parallel beta-helix repeat-containing protein n=1 Tax=Sphingomonas colocasiae TaxID=1848973 RepID=A0ABS7PVH1_9SPHN|nr:right-handed parallel beta-helix repeat-containing protein [Sphingomonas colocasiae]MBY8825357.1 right-handed parallel beta-helix repeat-containing protein [Sphingomonas colocasiae]